jgi:uncharacterized protein (DUF2141 family)
MIKITKKKVKVLCLLSFVGLAIVGLTNNNGFVHTVKSFSSGPPAGFSGAPDENNCASCHNGGANNGQFTITAPTNYTPGQTYQIQVRHTNTDTTRRRWGFELTALANSSAAGTFANLTTSTQTIGENGRFYVEHTSTGTFANQQNGALWTFNWTAPATNVGAVTFYAAGNQANNDGSTGGDQLYTTNATVPVAPVTVSRVFSDFDGDGKSDVSVFRPSNGSWFIQQSTAGFTGIAFGLSTDKLAPADYDGDGKTDVAVVRNGTWYLQRSSLGFTGIAFGEGSDIPMPADYDGDGKADVAVFRPSNGAWYLQRSQLGFTGITFGQNGDKPVAADYDGDGKADIAVNRAGTWYLQRSSLGFTGVTFGDGADKPTPADYDGDGKADVAVFRPSNGTWYLQRSQLGFTGIAFGISTDTPVAADYDGDGKTDVAVFRSGTWYLNRSTAGFTGIAFGESSDKPVPNAFVQ